MPVDGLERFDRRDYRRALEHQRGYRSLGVELDFGDRFEVTADRAAAGVWNPPHRWRFDGAIRWK